MRFYWKTPGTEWAHIIDPGYYRLEATNRPLERMMVMPPEVPMDKFGAFLHIGEVPDNDPTAAEYRYSLGFADEQTMADALTHAFHHSEWTIEQTPIDSQDFPHRWFLEGDPQAAIEPMTPMDPLGDVFLGLSLFVWRLR